MKILQNYGEVLAREDMQPSYLDRFSLENYNLPLISAIIPTFNRSPNPPEKDSNPLGWCLESLLAQKGGLLDEIIIVNDGSVDYTKELVGHFSNISPINIVYSRNNENKGSSVSRNLGIKAAKNDLVMFLDDDCIFSRHLFFGAAYTFSSLEEDVAALHLPIYHRKMMPVPIKQAEIGRLDLEKNEMEGHYDGFPMEYSFDLDNNLLDSELGILKPFEIKNLGGIFLARKKALEEVGGFSEFVTWKNGYREETNLALNLTDAGHRLFFTPDPKLYCVHLKYGAHSQEEKTEDPSLRRLISQSNIPRNGTGNRVDTEEWFFDRIISTYVTFGLRNMDAAKRYAEQTRRSFVERNKLTITGVGTRINDRKKRERIFETAVRKGNELMEKLA